MKSNDKNFVQQHAMRAGNRLRALEAISRGIRSRRQIQTEMNLAWGTVSACVAGLVKEKTLILEDRLRTDCFCIPPERLHGGNRYCYFSPDRNLLAGIEVKAGGFELRVCTADHRLVGRGSHECGKFRDVRDMGEQLLALIGKSGIPPSSIATVCLALTGAFDRTRSIWLKTSHLPQVDRWEMEALREFFPESELFFEHDIVSKARAIASAKDFVFFHIGDGVGLTACRNGIFDGGAHGFAGEIGHIPYPPGGKTCLEQILSLRGLCDCASADTDIAKRWEFLRPHLLWACVAALNLFDPEELILGGEAIEGCERFFPELTASLQAEAWVDLPRNIRFYKMKDCDTAWGAAFSPLRHLMKSMARGG